MTASKIQVITRLWTEERYEFNKQGFTFSNELMVDVKFIDVVKENKKTIYGEKEIDRVFLN